MRVRLKKLLSALGLKDVELSVLLVGDRAMRTLNRRYRSKDRTTDVLSFSFREGMHGSVQSQMLGDIVISLPMAERQACEVGESVDREIDRLLVHGLLHLLGYDHERGERDARRMRNRERTLLEMLHT